MELEQRIRQLDQGVRAIGVVILLFAGFLSARTAMQADEMERMFAELIGGKPLPTLTEVAIRFQNMFLLLTLLGPIAGIAAAFVCKSPRCALFTIAGGIFLCLLLGLFLFTVYYLPILTITTEMNSV